MNLESEFSWTNGSFLWTSGHFCWKTRKMQAKRGIWENMFWRHLLEKINAVSFFGGGVLTLGDK